MTYRPRTYYTESQKALMWERWQKGDVRDTRKRLLEQLQPFGRELGRLRADVVALDADPVANSVKQVRAVYPSNDQLRSHYWNLPVRIP